MKKFENIIRGIIVLVCIVFCMYIEGQAATVKKSDKQIIKSYCKQHYGKQYKVVIKKGGTIDKQLINRKGKHIIYVEKFNTVSNGKCGIVTSGPCKDKIVGYAKKVKTGKRVVSYIIYDPDSNSLESIGAIYTAGKLK